MVLRTAVNYSAQYVITHSLVKVRQYGRAWVVSNRNHCSKCNYQIPFEGCPTCPPAITKCPNCGTQVIVEYMSAEEYDSIVKDVLEKFNIDLTSNLVDLGDIKEGNS